MRFAVATPEDDPAIRRLLRDHPMDGAIRLTFEREPDYFRGAGIAGAQDQTIVAFSKGRLVCMGRCSRRNLWIDGKIVNAGYLAELRLDASARGQYAFVRGGYRFFHELQRASPAGFYFTSIAADNGRARRFLERGARGMPEYRFLSELVTLLVAVPRRPRISRVHLQAFAAGDVPELLRVLNESGQRRQLAAVWTEGDLCALETHGLPLKNFCVLKDGGAIVACGALWDQRSFRQTVIRGYAPAFAAMKPLVNVIARFRGMPGLPSAGASLAHAFLSPLAFAEGAEGLLPDFLEAMFPWAKKSGLDYLTLALPADDPHVAILRRRFCARVYRSYLYQVRWSDQEFFDATTAGKCFLPDVSLL